MVEARSCERFECLMTVLDEELASFYSSLWRSEARHCGDYLGFYKKRDPQGFASRLKKVIECDEAPTPQRIKRFDFIQVFLPSHR